jgi:hypothetical protein
VAGYLSMVQDVVFGLETSWDGIRFRPFITSRLRNETFAASNLIELRDFSYRQTRHQVRIHLPPPGPERTGVCGIRQVELNGKKIDNDFAAADSLLVANTWDIYLQPPGNPGHTSTLQLVDTSNEHAIFAPLPPTWDEAAQAAITRKDGRPVLHFSHPSSSNVVFNINRDGRLCAQAVTGTEWVDTTLADYSDTVISYTVEAVDPQSGNASYPSPTRRHQPQGRQQTIPAKDMQNRGGNLVAGHHFENWGQPGHELLARDLRVHRAGHYHLRAEFSNGAGPINTGITCAVKKLEIVKVGTNQVVAAGYLIMPQSGDWKCWHMSSLVEADLAAGQSYSLRIFEDDYSRNMSYFQHNERYTALTGGGSTPYNYVNIAAVHLDLIAARPARTSDQAANP